MFQLYDAHGPIEALHEATAVTIGVFDGVHRGHQALIAQLGTGSTATGLAPTVVTLTSHPSFVLGRRASEYWLDDPEEHLRLLFDAGARYVAVLPFTTEVASLPACAMARMLHERVNMRCLLLGYDSRFGSRRNDDFDRLPQLASELGFTLQKGEPCLVDGQPISSSRIRETLLQGNIDATAALLGRPYSLRGTVVHGRGVGRTLGFPTANIDLSSTRKMLPKEGVYAVSVRPTTTHPLPAKIGMANLGSMPTFGIEQPSLEVHILDYAGDLYGQSVEVLFLRRLRDTVQFDSPEALKRQLQADLNTCRQL